MSYTMGSSQSQDLASQDQAQAAFQTNMVNLYNAVNTNATNLYGAKTAAYTAENNAAVHNPQQFAKESAIASLLMSPPGGYGQATAPGVNKPNDSAVQNLTQLQKDALNNQMNTATLNPVPSSSMIGAAPTPAPVPTLTGPGGSNNSDLTTIQQPSVNLTPPDQRTPVTPPIYGPSQSDPNA